MEPGAISRTVGLGTSRAAEPARAPADLRPDAEEPRSSPGDHFGTGGTSGIWKSSHAGVKLLASESVTESPVTTVFWFHR